MITGRSLVACTACPWRAAPIVRRDGGSLDRRDYEVAVAKLTKHVEVLGHIVLVRIKTYSEDFTEITETCFGPDRKMWVQYEAFEDAVAVALR